MRQNHRYASFHPSAALLLGCVCLIAAPFGFAEELVTETRALPDFHALDAAISGKIRLERGDTTSITIEARQDTLERLRAEVEEGVLRIFESSGRGWWRNSGPVRIRIGYRALNAIDLSGSADIRTDRLETERFHVGINGSSNVRIPQMSVDQLHVRVGGSGDLEVDDLEADTVDLEVSGSGDLTFNGRTGMLIAVIQGSGTVDGARLESRRAEVRVSGSGSADVWVTGHLDARISGSGDIEYRGDAEVVSEVTGSGDLSRR